MFYRTWRPIMSLLWANWGDIFIYLTQDHSCLLLIRTIATLFFSFPSNTETNNAHKTCNNSTSIWHQRWGHPSNVALKYVPFFSNTKNVFDKCDVFPLAKQTQKYFPTIKIVSFDIFEIVHVNTWRPYKHASNCRAHFFFLTLVDNYSRSTCTFLMKAKHQTPYILRKLIIMIKNHFQKPIKYSRSDNGFEFLSKQCQNIFDELGIIHQRSSVYTPQQNGVVERRHRSILQWARCNTYGFIVYQIMCLSFDV